MPSDPQVGGVDVLGLGYLVLVLAVIFLPMVLGRGDPPPGRSNSDSDDDDGGGSGPPPPPTRRVRPEVGFRLTTRTPRVCGSEATTAWAIAFRPGLADPRASRTEDAIGPMGDVTHVRCGAPVARRASA
jgi:cell division septation protein DedD